MIKISEKTGLTYLMFFLLAFSLIMSEAWGQDNPAENMDTVAAELEEIMLKDEAALDEVDVWIRENERLRESGGEGTPDDVLNRRIKARLNDVMVEYQDFLKTHTNYADAYLAYGSFLNDIGEVAHAEEQWEKARMLNPENPAAWNNLANHYGHYGPVTNAFAYYQKAIELDPNEPVYYQNFATTVYLFRRDAEQFFNFSEPQVFDYSLRLYRDAMELDPDNFLLATDFAMSFYGIDPFRPEQAREAWKHALEVAKSELERESVYIHLARVEIKDGNAESAEEYLSKVKTPQYEVLKKRLSRNLNKLENSADGSDVRTGQEEEKDGLPEFEHSENEPDR